MNRAPPSGSHRSQARTGVIPGGNRRTRGKEAVISSSYQPRVAIPSVDGCGLSLSPSEHRREGRRGPPPRGNSPRTLPRPWPAFCDERCAERRASSRAPQPAGRSRRDERRPRDERCRAGPSGHFRDQLPGAWELDSGVL